MISRNSPRTIFNILPLIFSIFLLLILSSCHEDPYLYDRSGFDNGIRPVVRPNPNTNRIPPDSWAQERYNSQQPPQRRQENYQPQPYQTSAPQQQQQQYAPPPQPYQDRAPQQGYAPPPPQQNGSRYYNNPYVDVPQQNYNPYYDSEQYYTPPNYYYNNEDPRNFSY